MGVGGKIRSRLKGGRVGGVKRRRGRRRSGRRMRGRKKKGR